MNFGKGLVAGFVATAVLSTIMIMKSTMGLMPQFNAIELLAQALGQPGNLIVGWIAHFVVGTVIWGLLFAAVSGILPGAFWMKGLIFGVVGWIAMGVVFFPFVNQGLFGLSLGAVTPVATAMLHMIFGAVLGATYGQLRGYRASVE